MSTDDSNGQDKTEEKKYNYDLDFSRPKVKVDVRMRDEDYEKIKEERDMLQATLDTVALQKFEDERSKLLRIASAEDRPEIEVLSSPEQLEFYRGKYSSKMETSPFHPETPGFATTKEHSSSLGLQDTFDSPKQMGEYFLAISQERDPSGTPTPRAIEARKCLRQLGRKFWDSLASATTTQRIEIPIQPILTIRGRKYPHVVGRGEKSEGSSSTEAITKEGR